MTQDFNRKVIRPTWDSSIANIAAPTPAPTTAADGVEVAANIRGEFIHITTVKTNTCTLDIWGYIAEDINEWFNIGTITFAGSVNEGEVLTMAAAYDRIHTQVTAIGGGTVDVYVGQGV